MKFVKKLLGTPKSVFLKYFLIVILFSAKISHAQSPKENYLKAEEYHNIAKYDECINLLATVKKSLGRTNPKIETLLASAYYNNADYTKARLSIERIKMLVSSTAYQGEAYNSIRKLEADINSELDDQQAIFIKEKRERQTKRMNSAISFVQKAEKKSNAKTVSYNKAVKEQKKAQKKFKAKIKLQEDEMAFNKAIELGTIESYQNYLSKGFREYEKNAKFQIDLLNFKIAEKTHTKDAYAFFLKNYQDTDFNADEIINNWEVTKLEIRKDSRRSTNDNLDAATKILKLQTYKNLDNLILAGDSFKQIPKQIYEMNSFSNLILKYTEISQLSNEFCDLTFLKGLYLSNNSYKSRLVSLPNNIGKLVNLTELILTRNNLKELPSSLCELKELRFLYLGHNSLTKLPGNIGNLLKLEELHLYGNSLTFLPVSIGGLQSLRILKLSSNYRLNSLPESIGNLSKLEELDLRYTSIQELPESIHRLGNLELLKLSKSRKKYLKKSLRSLKKSLPFLEVEWY